ncbi:maleylpyruvate isomerase N-terminal domain-containing protein [Mycobacterium kyorinense]|nr:maleylpyruvate isomerase N-terminal domain-containing protein [Mycobacterium kyorinense]
MAAGPLDQLRRADPETRTALANAVTRSAALWRAVDDPGAPVPGLSWSIGQTAAHVVADLREYTEALTRHLNGDRAAPKMPDGSPARLRTAVNDRHLTDVCERDPHRLANMLEETASHYLAAAAAVDSTEHVTIPTADSLVLEPAVMTCLLLGEQLLHGLDVARAAGRPWTIDRDDALLVVPAALALAPNYLRASRANDLHITFELRIRGGGRYRLTVDHGTAVVTSADQPAGGRADCVITADPVTFLLLGYGRVAQWPQILRGRLRAGGRKPWLAAKFGTLLASP